MNLHEKLTTIQSKLDVPKNHYNKFSDFNYRNIEDIQAAVKPLLVEYKCSMRIHDEVLFIGDKLYVKATVTLGDLESECDPIQGFGYARETMSKPKFDDSQLTGSASTYSRKYAITGLFLLDDGSDDADGMNNDKPKQTSEPQSKSQDDDKPWYNDFDAQKDWFQKQINEGAASSVLIEKLTEKYKVNTTVRTAINSMGGQ